METQESLKYEIATLKKEIVSWKATAAYFARQVMELEKCTTANTAEK